MKATGAIVSVLISRCICRNTSFADLLPQARRTSWTLDDLIRETGCGGQCGLCRPYLRVMLSTGQTEFHELLTQEEPPRDGGTL
jgi:bacterioferritin-associated ferredoxin